MTVDVFDGMKRLSGVDGWGSYQDEMISAFLLDYYYYLPLTARRRWKIIQFEVALAR